MAHHPLRDGQTVDLRDSLTHGQEKAILRATALARSDPALQPDVPDGYLLAMVVGWSVRDAAGEAIPWPDTEHEQRQAIERAPGEVIDQIFALSFKAYRAWRKAADDRGKAASDRSTGSQPG